MAAVKAYTTRALVYIRRSERSSEVKGGVFRPARSDTKRSRSFPGVVPMLALVGALSLVKKVSVGRRPAVSMRLSREYVIFLRPPSAGIPAVLCSFAAVSAETTAIVGAMERLAKVRSTPGPATELINTVACENNAARVRHKLYELVKASAGRKVSEAEKRCAAGSEVMREPTAAARFCDC